MVIYRHIDAIRQKYIDIDIEFIKKSFKQRMRLQGSLMCTFNGSWSLFRRFVVPKVRCSEGQLFRRFVVPKVFSVNTTVNLVHIHFSVRACVRACVRFCGATVIFLLYIRK